MRRGAHGPDTERPELGFAFLVHPAVQGVRWLSKALLAWWVAPAAFGDAALAGVVSLGVCHAACRGLDDAVVQARTLDAVLWRGLRRSLVRSALEGTVLLAVAGSVLAAVLEDSDLGLVLLALAPVVLLSNAGVLPNALLVRASRFRSLFYVDVATVVAFAGCAVSVAVLGGGVWSFVVGWIASSVVNVALARGCARPFEPVAADGGDDVASTRRFGTRVMGAAVAGHAVERADTVAVGVLLGVAHLGIYEASLHLAGCVVAYGKSLAERCLYPTLARQERVGELRQAFTTALGRAALIAGPVHVGIACSASAVVAWGYPAGWAAMAGVVPLLALASGCRCLELVGTTALKAAGEAGCVLRFSAVQLGGLAFFVTAGARFGIEGVALAVLVHRAGSAVAANALAWRAVAGGRAPRARPRIPERLGVLESEAS